MITPIRVIDCLRTKILLYFTIVLCSSLVPIRGRVEQVLTVCDSLVAAPDVSSAEREAAHAIRLYVDGMPTLALERGLFTERELMDRFQRLVPICRNVALVPEVRIVIFYT